MTRTGVGKDFGFEGHTGTLVWRRTITLTGVGIDFGLEHHNTQRCKDRLWIGRAHRGFGL